MSISDSGLYDYLFFKSSSACDNLESNSNIISLIKLPLIVHILDMSKNESF